MSILDDISGLASSVATGASDLQKAVAPIVGTPQPSATSPQAPVVAQTKAAKASMMDAVKKWWPVAAAVAAGVLLLFVFLRKKR